MPIGFLTEAEREQLNRFPEHIPEEDLRIVFSCDSQETAIMDHNGLLQLK
jgi:hypothetical protein